MTPEEAINIADEALKIYSGRSLTDIQRLILQESFFGKGYEEMRGYEHQHFKNEGSALWKLLSEALGEKVSKTSFKGALEKRLKSSQIVLSLPHPNIYDSEKWVGRSPLIEKLLNKFQQNTRIVWLTGLSGIGKTTLGECIAVKAWENNPSFQWIHLEISASQLTDFATGAREILSQLGEKDFDQQEMNDPKWLSDRLLQKLQSSFYWLQIDALEKLISANEFIDSYWLTFFENCLNTNHFPSRLLLTSQVLPNSLINWCDRFSNIWHQETLKGLENEESEQYFVKNGIIIDESNQTILYDITQAYEGHPLVLQVITGEILQVYQGDVTAYWKVNQAEFEQVSRELNSSRLTETDYNEQLARRVRERVKKSLKQLPEKVIALLCRSAVYRRPVPKSFWLGLITEFSPKEQTEAYRILGDRALIETESSLIRQHNLVRDIAYDWLREDEIIWKTTEVKAAELWLNEYQPEENAENLEKVRGYLEAFYHYFDAEEWEKTTNLFMKSINFGEKQRLWIQQLDIWGYYEEQFKVCNPILGKLNNDVDNICLSILGSYNHHLEKYEKAINYFQQKLKLCEEINDQKSKCNSLGKLGDICISRGNAYTDKRYYLCAAKYYQGSLRNTNKINDLDERKKSQSDAYGSLGIAYRHLAKYDKAIYDKAIKVIKKSLKFCCEPEDILGKSSNLVALGNIYYAREQYKEAEIYYQSSLEIKREINDKKGIGIVMANLADTQIKLEKYAHALSNLQKSLAIFQDIRFLTGETEVLTNFAELYYKMKQPKLARQHCEQALQIATELGLPLAQECQKLLLKIEEAENC